MREKFSTQTREAVTGGSLNQKKQKGGSYVLTTHP